MDSNEFYKKILSKIKIEFTPAKLIEVDKLIEEEKLKEKIKRRNSIINDLIDEKNNDE